MSRTVFRPALVGVLVGTWALLGALDALVWMPQALAPSTPLPSIYAAIADIGDVPWVVPWPLLLLAVGVGTAVIISRPHGRVRTAALRYRVAAVLLVVAVLTFLWLWTGLPMQLWLSNHLPPFEGGSSTFGAVYGWLGTAAGVAAVVAGALGWSASRAGRARGRS